MSYGIALANARGETFFTTDSITWNYIGSFIASADESLSITMSELDLCSETLVQRFFVGAAPANQEAYIHNVSIIGTTVSATTGTYAGKVATLVVVLGR